MKHQRDRIQSLLTDAIPLAAFMGASVETVDESGVVVLVPFDNNRNHKGTAFGGSLATAAILAGWAVTASLLDAPQQPNVVIHSHRMRFLRPARGAFKAVAAAPAAQRVREFQDAVRRQVPARLEVTVTLTASGDTVARMRGVYAVSANSVQAATARRGAVVDE